MRWIGRTNIYLKLISEFADFRDWYFIFHFLQFSIFAYLRICIFVYLHICVFAFSSELLLYFPISSLSSKSSKHVMGRRMCINLVIKNFVSNFPNIAFEICKTKLPILNKLSPPNTQTQIQNHQINKYKHTTFFSKFNCLFSTTFTAKQAQPIQCDERYTHIKYH